MAHRGQGGCGLLRSALGDPRKVGSLYIASAADAWVLFGLGSSGHSRPAPRDGSGANDPKRQWADHSLRTV